MHGMYRLSAEQAHNHIMTHEAVEQIYAANLPVVFNQFTIQLPDCKSVKHIEPFTRIRWSNEGLTEVVEPCGDRLALV